MAAKSVGKARVKTARASNDAVHPVQEHPQGEITGEGGTVFTVAFKGDAELINARWDLDNGRTADFRIAGNGFERLHPFKHFQRQRGGRLGTRFAAAIVDQNGQIRINTEVMLKGWSDNATGGQQFSLWLDDESTLHPFAGCRHRKREEPGEMFKVSLLVVPEEQEQIPQEGKIRTVKPSNTAHLLVTGNMFIQFLRETKPNMANWDPPLAKRYVKSKLEIESLSDLDRLPAKVLEFQEKIVKPFERWRGGH